MCWESSNPVRSRSDCGADEREDCFDLREYTHREVEGEAAEDVASKAPIEF